MIQIEYESHVESILNKGCADSCNSTSFYEANDTRISYECCSTPLCNHSSSNIATIIQITIEIIIYFFFFD